MSEKKTNDRFGNLFPFILIPAAIFLALYIYSVSEDREREAERRERENPPALQYATVLGVSYTPASENVKSETNTNYFNRHYVVTMKRMDGQVFAGYVTLNIKVSYSVNDTVTYRVNRKGEVYDIKKSTARKDEPNNMKGFPGGANLIWGNQRVITTTDSTLTPDTVMKKPKRRWTKRRPTKTNSEQPASPVMEDNDYE